MAERPTIGIRRAGPRALRLGGGRLGRGVEPFVEHFDGPLELRIEGGSFGRRRRGLGRGRLNGGLSIALALQSAPSGLAPYRRA